MTHYPALIAHESDRHPACESLLATLERIDACYPQMWVQSHALASEEQLPASTLFRRGLNSLLLGLLRLGHRSDAHLALGHAPQGTLCQSLAEADIIHLQGLRSGTISLRALAKLSQPIICDASDDFCLSALCHDCGSCQQYLFSCRNCPSSRFHSLIEALFHRKQAQLAAIRKLVLVAPSRIRQHELQRSPMLRGRDIRHIGIGVDCQALRAHPRIDCKLERDIQPHQRVIAFRCSSFEPQQAEQHDKQAKLIQELCYALRDEGFLSLHIMLLGWNHALALPFPCSYSDMPEQDSRERARLYSSIDILIHLSEQKSDERHSLEALACQVPIITHRGGNMSEYVEDKQRGFSLRGKLELRGSELLEQCKKLLHAPVLRSHLGLHGRRYIEHEHEAGFISELYRQLYQELRS